MAQRKSIALYRKNLLALKNGDEEHAFWLYSHSEFDTKGNLTEQSIYAQDGSLVERTINEYDENGFLLREKYFVEESEPSEENSYQRNEQGLVEKELKHYSDGSIDTTTYHYDSQHRIISKITINDEGETEQKVLNEYKDEFLKSTKILDADGELIKLDEFRYDEKGNSVEHKRFDADSGDDSFVVTRYNSHGRKLEETTFDEEGNEVSKTLYSEDDSGNLISIIEEGPLKDLVIKFTYDDRGNIIMQEEIDNSGRQLVSVKREYDEENNMLRSEVFIDGQGKTLPQHYEIKFDYTFFED